MLSSTELVLEFVHLSYSYTETFKNIRVQLVEQSCSDRDGGRGRPDAGAAGDGRHASPPDDHLPRDALWQSSPHLRHPQEQSSAEKEARHARAGWFKVFQRSRPIGKSLQLLFCGNCSNAETHVCKTSSSARPAAICETLAQ